MSIRFTKTEKWNDSWFRNLPPDAKLAFLYLCDNCDCAGFWEIDTEAAEWHTKLPNFSKILPTLAKSVIVRGRFLWLKNFIRHQRNFPLCGQNKAHGRIIARLQEMISVFPEAKSLLGDANNPPKKGDNPPSEGDGRGMQGGFIPPCNVTSRTRNVSFGNVTSSQVTSNKGGDYKGGDGWTTPPDQQKWKDIALMVGLTEEEAEVSYENFQANTWRRANGIPLESWDAVRGALKYWRNNRQRFPKPEKKETIAEKHARMKREGKL